MIEAYQLIVVAIIVGAAVGCSPARPSTKLIVAPAVVPYSDGVQKEAAAEMAEMGPPCPRDAVFGGCSAVKRMVIDFGDMREQARALRNGKH